MAANVLRFIKQFRFVKDGCGAWNNSRPTSAPIVGSISVISFEYGPPPALTHPSLRRGAADRIVICKTDKDKRRKCQRCRRTGPYLFRDASLRPRYAMPCLFQLGWTIHGAGPCWSFCFTGCSDLMRTSPKETGTAPVPLYTNSVSISV